MDTGIKVLKILENEILFKKIGSGLAVFFVFLFFTLSISVKIDLPTADLGRHIKNGEIILTGAAEERSAVLSENFYSYTEPNFPFVNHHWLTGVIFYLVNKLTGFTGLSFLFIILNLATFAIFVKLAKDKSNLWLVLSVSLLAIPIIATRTEIRPEIFSYFLSAIFFYICQKVTDEKISPNWLSLLPILELFWVNLHSNFIFGFFIAGVYFLYYLSQKSWHMDKIKKYAVVLLLMVIASLINPSGFSGASVPFTIFSNYGYRLVENQSIPFLENLGVGNSLAFMDFKILAVAILLFLTLLIWRDRKKIFLPHLLFIGTFGLISFMSIKYLPFFGFFAIPALSFYLFSLSNSEGRSFFEKNKKTILFALIIILAIAGFIFTAITIRSHKATIGVGLRDKVSGAAIFFKTNQIKGPVLNNYDIGGYLIYHLYPNEKVFFDNRPEAYSADFIQNTYIKSLDDEKKFEALDKKYNFNSIFFYYRDFTPWGQNFLTKIIYNPSWSPVFADEENLILLKRNEQNRTIIDKFEIPKSAFSKSNN